MNLDFSPEQKQFREQIRRFLQKSDGLSQARSILDGKVQNYSAPIWKGLAEMSVQAIAIPEEHSGIGLGALELCVAAEEIGRALAPVPFLSSVCLCAEAIRLFGSEEQKAKWLPGLASGEVIGTWAEADQPADEASFRFGALSGTKVPVLDGMVAQVAVVIMRDAADAPALPVYLFSHESGYAALTRHLAQNTAGIFVFTGDKAYLASYLEGQGRDSLRRAVETQPRNGNIALQPDEIILKVQ